MDGQAGRWMDGQMNRWKVWQMEGLVGRWAGRQIDKWSGWQMDKCKDAFLSGWVDITKYFNTSFSLKVSWKEKLFMDNKHQTNMGIALSVLYWLNANRVIAPGFEKNRFERGLPFS